MSVYYAKGTHRATIVSQAFLSTDYGTQLAVKIMPENGEHERTVYLGLTDEHGQPSKFTNNAGEEIDVAKKSLEVLAYLGLPPDEKGTYRLSVLDPEHPECFDLTGKVVECYCQHKTKADGTEVETWYINTPRALQGKPVEKNAIRKLDSLFGKAMKAAAKEVTVPATAAAAPTPESIAKATDEAIEEAGPDVGDGDDDCPF